MGVALHTPHQWGSYLFINIIRSVAVSLLTSSIYIPCGIVGANNTSLFVCIPVSQKTALPAMSHI